MNSTFFSCKRAHHSCLRMSRRLLGTDITPARFDMLYILDVCDPRGFGFFQRQLCTLLGVTAPVVSRMLTSLKELGYIYRQLDWEDGRRRIITLTDKGRALFRRLVAHIRGMDDLLVDAALCRERTWSDADTWTERALRERRGSFRDHHRDLLRTFDDRATLDFDRPRRSSFAA
jgi:DNA-binding MarR family transcriptional regulator